jgi:CDP-diacylglycerol--glycerol-3-phosphate 3-phosphatidyltransferase
MTTANKITLVRIALIPVFIVLLLIDQFGCQIAAAAVFVIASLTDLVDGHIARKYNQITNFGKFIDPIADKLLVVSGMVILCGQGRIPGWVVVIFIAREFIISGFRLVAADKGTVIAAGKLGKYKTATQMVAVILITLCLPASGAPAFGTVGVWLSNIFLYVSLVLAIWSCAVYVRDNRAVLAEEK